MFLARIFVREQQVKPPLTIDIFLRLERLARHVGRVCRSSVARELSVHSSVLAQWRQPKCVSRYHVLLLSLQSHEMMNCVCSPTIRI